MFITRKYLYPLGKKFDVITLSLMGSSFEVYSDVVKLYSGNNALGKLISFTAAKDFTLLVDDTEFINSVGTKNKTITKNSTIVLRRVLNGYEILFESDVTINTVLTGKTQLFFLGDSITFGVATTYGFSYPQQVMKRLNDDSKFTKVQRGFSGQNSSWFNTNELVNTINLFDKINYKNVVCVVYFGTNDLCLVDLPTFKTDITNTYKALKNAGAEIVLVPVLNRTDRFSTPDYDAKRLAFNEYIYSNYKILGSELADMKKQPVYASEATLNTAFFAANDPDGLTGVHPKNRGAACIAEEVSQAIARLHGINLPLINTITETVPTQFGSQPPNNGISSNGVGNGAGLPLDTTPDPSVPVILGNVNWVNLVNTTLTGSKLTKTSGVDGWNAGATSSKGISNLSYSNPELGRAVFSDVLLGGSRIFGFSHNNPDASYTSINYAWYVDGQDRVIFEDGELKYNAPALDNSKYEIVVYSNYVTYIVNDVVVYTSTKAPNFPLFIDTSLYIVADSYIDNVTLLGNIVNI